MIYEANYSPKFRREYKKFRKTRRDTAKAVGLLIRDILKHPTTGLGRPERLKYMGGNSYSREIDRKNRLVYRIIGEDEIYFETCLGHYGDH